MSKIPANVDRYEYSLAVLDYDSPFVWCTYAALAAAPFIAIILCATILAPVYFFGLMSVITVSLYLVIWAVSVLVLKPIERSEIMKIYHRNIARKPPV